MYMHISLIAKAIGGTMLISPCRERAHQPMSREGSSAQVERGLISPAYGFALLKIDKLGCKIQERAP